MAIFVYTVVVSRCSFFSLDFCAIMLLHVLLIPREAFHQAGKDIKHPGRKENTLKQVGMSQNEAVSHLIQTLPASVEERILIYIFTIML